MWVSLSTTDRPLQFLIGGPTRSLLLLLLLPHTPSPTDCEWSLIRRLLNNTPTITWLYVAFVYI